MLVPCGTKTEPEIGAVNTTRACSCSRMNPSRHALCSGEQFAPVMATRRPPGASLATAEDTVETVLADPVTADLLRVDTGLPLLLIRRTGWDHDGRTVEWSTGLFRGDRFRFISRQQLS